MAKKIAVLVRERQEEALRVAVGLTLNENRVEVYVLDREVAATPGECGEHRGPQGDGDADRHQLRRQRGISSCSRTPELARRLAACDVVLPY